VTVGGIVKVGLNVGARVLRVKKKNVNMNLYLYPS
jgi:hypothetical protein